MTLSVRNDLTRLEKQFEDDKIGFSDGVQREFAKYQNGLDGIVNDARSEFASVRLGLEALHSKTEVTVIELATRISKLEANTNNMQSGNGHQRGYLPQKKTNDPNNF